jgi:putative FmdB family regulatory protein
MFTYLYICKECDTHFAVELRTMKKGTELTLCPTCSSSNVIRVWSVLPVHYHAGGFYSHPTVHTEIEL